MTKLSLACGLVLSAALTACASAPQDSPRTATAAPGAGTAIAAASGTRPKLVCEDSNQIGSHMAAHICLTPEQVEARRKEAQQAAQDFQNRPHAVSADGKPPV